MNKYKYVGIAVLAIFVVLIALQIRKVSVSTSDAASGSTISEQRAKVKHKNVKNGPAKEKFPEVKLSKKSRQKEAITELGDKLPEVAAWYDLSASNLENELLSDSSLWVDEEGQLLYIEEISDTSSTDQATTQPITTLDPNGAVIPDTGIFPDNQTFLLHSSPNSKKRIYLDFDGYPSSARFPAFDLDGNPSLFNTEELQYIQKVWQIVAEDFIPFDIDVTTEAPTQDLLTRSSLSDEYYGAWALITSPSFDSTIACGCGGFAYLSAFFKFTIDATYPVSATTYTKSYVPPGSLWSGNKSVNSVASTTSHELGHALGFMHKGILPDMPYYSGHGGNIPLELTSWGPIMGSASIRNLTQWSKGEYPNAKGDAYYGMADEIRGLASYLGYYPDDTGNTISSAKPLAASGSSMSAYGVIEQATDVDVYSFDTEGGVISLMATPALFGPNLDIKMELLDGQGNVIANDNSVSDIKATISLTLQAGNYYVTIDGVGKPATSTDPGYSDYGSLGQYKISGEISTMVANQSPLAVMNASPTTGTAPLTVAFDASQSSDPDGTIASYAWDFGDGTTSTGVTTSHLYTTAGTFTPKLTVTDNGGQSHSVSTNIVVSSSTVTPITAPANLKTSAQGKVVTLKWVDKSLNEEGFYIERAVKTITPVYERVGEVTANSILFTETLTTANTYLYRVQAFNKTTNTTSSYSNVASRRVR